MFFTVIKGLLSLAIIYGATYVGKKAPSLAGLIGVMPLTGMLAFIWLCIENKSRQDLMTEYSKGAFWGILPSLAFFAALLFGIKYGLPVWAAISAAMVIWIGGAVIHQYWLG